MTIMRSFNRIIRNVHVRNLGLALLLPCGVSTPSGSWPWNAHTVPLPGSQLVTTANCNTGMELSPAGEKQKQIPQSNVNIVSSDSSMHVSSLKVNDTNLQSPEILPSTYCCYSWVVLLMLIIMDIKFKNFWVRNFMQRVLVVLMCFSRRKFDPEMKTKYTC